MDKDDKKYMGLNEKLIDQIIKLRFNQKDSIYFKDGIRRIINSSMVENKEDMINKIIQAWDEKSISNKSQLLLAIKDKCKKMYYYC